MKRIAVIALSLVSLGAMRATAQTPDADLAEGMRLIQVGDFEAAVTTLDRVVQRLIVSPKGARDLIDARVQLGVAYVFLERMEEARSQFKEALIADRTLTLSAKDYPPRVINAFEELRREVAPVAAPTSVPTPTPPPATDSPRAPSPAQPTRGGSKAPLLIGGAVVLAGAGAAVALLKGPDPLDVDDDGDGVSERGGDCNDTDSSVRPGGGFTFAVDFSFRGSIACSTRNTQQVYRVRNNSCNAISIQRLSVEQASGGACPSGFTRDLVVTASSVPPGVTTTIRTGTDAGRSTAFCCSNPPCTAGSCLVTERYTVTTDQGPQTLTNSFTSVNATGFDCPLCTAVVSHHFVPGVEAPACLVSTAPWD